MKVKNSASDKRIKVQPIKGLGVLSFDFDNNLPARQEQIILDSSTGKACLRIYTKFIVGRGVLDPSFWNAKINSEGLTVDVFVRNISRQLAQHKGFAFHVNRNLATGKVTEVNLSKFKDFRLPELETEEGKEHKDQVAFALWDSAKAVKKDSLIWYDRFSNSIEKIQEQIEKEEDPKAWKGQVYYWTPEGEYPLPEFDSVIEDMETESELKRFRKRTAKSNFLGSHILITGKQEEGSEDDETNVIQDNSSDPLIEELEKMQGGENAGKFLVLEKERPEDPFELHKIELQNYDDLYSNTLNTTKESIVEGFLIPKPLLLRGTSSIGSSKEIQDSTEVYNALTDDERRIISEVLEEVFSEWHEEGINPSNDYSIIPLPVNREISSEYFPFVSKNEIRTSIDLPEVEEAEANKKTMAETLGVGGTQSLVAVISDPLLTNEQKVSTLKILFGLPDNEANELIFGKVEPQNETR